MILRYLLCALPAFALPIYQATAIGPDGYYSSATAISSSGAVVGNYETADGTFRAFLWQDGQVTTLAMPAGAVQTWATAVYGAGQAGGYTDSAAAPQGVLWNDLGVPVSTAGSYIKGLNGNGDAAGMAIGGDGAGYAFLTHDGQVILLGQPAGGGWSTANGINAQGAAAGTAMNANGAFRAFAASPSGATTLLPGLGGSNSYAQAIGDNGAVAGHAQTAGGTMQATVWINGSANPLGTLGGSNSYAYAINAGGQVAGYSDLLGGGSAAFLCTDGALFDLNALLAPGSGWQLLAAYGINNRGQIVGTGIYNGQTQAFLLSPLGVDVPEPATAWVLAPLLLLWIVYKKQPSRPPQ